MHAKKTNFKKYYLMTFYWFVCNECLQGGLVLINQFKSCFHKLLSLNEKISCFTDCLAYENYNNELTMDFIPYRKPSKYQKSLLILYIKIGNLFIPYINCKGPIKGQSHFI